MQNSDKQASQANQAADRQTAIDADTCDIGVGASRGGTFAQANLKLGAEAASDFRALHGYWRRIIVKDMSCDFDDELPRLSIA